MDYKNFRRYDLAGMSAVRTDTLDALVAQIRQHEATIAQINQKLHELSMREQEVKERDYQSLMALQNVMAELKDLDSDFAPIYESCKQYTMTSVERLYGLYKAVEYVVRAGIRGDCVETGVWKGGSMMLVAATLRRLGDTSRRLFLLDTYEGHPRPDPERDVDLWGNRSFNEWQQHRKTDETSDWGYVSIDEVRENMARTGYPMENVFLVKGMVERTAADNCPEEIALLRLDTDWYESTKVALEVFYPRLVTSGVLVVDDYGHYQGQRQAVDAYFADKQPMLFNRLDYSCRIGVKVAPGR